MSGSEDDDDDLFKDFEEAECENINCSANLFGEVGQDKVVAQVSFGCIGKGWAPRGGGEADTQPCEPPSESCCPHECHAHRTHALTESRLSGLPLL